MLSCVSGIPQEGNYTNSARLLVAPADENSFDAKRDAVRTGNNLPRLVSREPDKRRGKEIIILRKKYSYENK